MKTHLILGLSLMAIGSAMANTTDTFDNRLMSQITEVHQNGFSAATKAPYDGDALDAMLHFQIATAHDGRFRSYPVSGPSLSDWQRNVLHTQIMTVHTE